MATKSKGVDNFSMLEPISVSVYPNPVVSGNELTLNIQGIEDASTWMVKVVDIIGKTVLNNTLEVIKNETVNIPLHNQLYKGIYIITVSNGEFAEYQKLIVK